MLAPPVPRVLIPIACFGGETVDQIHISFDPVRFGLAYDRRPNGFDGPRSPAPPDAGAGLHSKWMRKRGTPRSRCRARHSPRRTRPGWGVNQASAGQSEAAP
jgi:hypothetical protein